MRKIIFNFCSVFTVQQIFGMEFKSAEAGGILKFVLNILILVGKKKIYLLNEGVTLGCFPSSAFGGGVEVHKQI